MFLFKFWSYIVGYVIISIEGQRLEKLINMAVSRGIYLWDTSWQRENLLFVKVRISGFMALRHIARKLRCRMRIQGKGGVPFLYARLSKRKMLVAGAVGCLLTLYSLSSFVLFLEVTGNEQIPRTQIESLAKGAGLYKGVFKWKVDLDRVEKVLSAEIPQLAWVSIEIKGTRAFIRVAEKVYAKEEDNLKHAHIVASKDGLVQEVLVLTGMAMVQDGDTVKKGQLLISGILVPEVQEEAKLETEEQEEPRIEPKYLRADGIVRARVWYRGYGEAPVVKTGFKRTGQQATNLYIKIGSKKIILKGPKTHGFGAFEEDAEVKKIPKWRNLSIPVEVINTTYHELEHYREDIGVEGANKQAVKTVVDKLRKQLPPGAKILKQQVKQVSAGEADLVRVQVIMETLEDVGVAKAYSKPEVGGR